jgi:hypothetical protein
MAIAARIIRALVAAAIASNTARRRRVGRLSIVRPTIAPGGVGAAVLAPTVEFAARDTAWVMPEESTSPDLVELDPVLADLGLAG